MPDQDRLISVVLPVYNEHANIETCLRRLHAALRDIDHEILVCYDLEKDTTLEAIARMDDPPPSVRLVRNDLGPGVAFALKAGFRAARGDVIVTTMADLSDPPELIPLMAARIRDEGADVVSGSRYVRGGLQHGGPKLKGLLSRMSGLTLRHGAGLGTHDATTNFRAYSRTLVERVPVVSRKGFEVALELTVKAHLGGYKVVEIPSTWTDRTEGESRFRLWKWLPHYLRWYVAALAAPVFVAAVWLVLSAGLAFFVHARGLVIPFFDEWEVVPFVTGDRPVTPAWLWAQHNEHRIPMTKLLFLTSVWTGGSFRAPQYLNALALSALGAILIVAARRMRGRTSYTDAFLPMLVMHWGHVENVLWGFQIGLVFPALLLGIILMLLAPPSPPDARRVLSIGICALLLPLFGGALGISYAAPLLLWLGLAGSGRAAGSRRLFAWIPAGLLAALTFSYMIGYERPSYHPLPPGAAAVVRTMLEFLGLPLGLTAAWLMTCPFTIMMFVACLGHLLQWIRSHPEERLRIWGLTLAGASVFAPSLAIGFGRAGLGEGAGAASRYVLLASLILVWVYLAAGATWSRPAARTLHLCLLLLGAVAFRQETRDGYRWATARLEDAEALRAEAREGLRPEEIAARHPSIYPKRETMASGLALLRARSLEPYGPPDGR